MKDPKERYCKFCGEKMKATADNYMNWVKNPNYWDKFNTVTGNPIDYGGFRYECTKSRWYNLHDSYFIRNNY